MTALVGDSVGESGAGRLDRVEILEALAEQAAILVQGPAPNFVGVEQRQAFFAIAAYVFQLQHRTPPRPE